MDLSARCQFYGTARAAAKCMISFNHCGKRHKEMSCNAPSSNYPRCGEIETCNRIMQCDSFKSVNEQFVDDLISEMQLAANATEQK